MLIDGTREHRVALTSRSRYRAHLKVARGFLSLGSLGLLVYSLRGLNCITVLTELPTRPLFYLLFVIGYLWLPASEIFAYRVIWPLGAWKSLPIFIKKRIYNREVFQYTGELLLFSWARRQLDRPASRIAKDIRDQNIVSAVASTLVAIVLVAIFIYLGDASPAAWIGRQGRGWLIVVAIGTAACSALIVHFRRHFFAVAPGTALTVFGIHAGRFALEQAIQVGMWWSALPDVPLRVWWSYAALSLVIARIPLLTNRDLLFTSIGITLAADFMMRPEAIAVVMIVVAALGKAVTVLFFTGFTIAARRNAAQPVASICRHPLEINRDDPIPSAAVTI